DQLKKDDGRAQHRQVLESIAAGKKARDLCGFSTDYAEQVLRKLDGKKAETGKGEPLSHGLAWFPDKATMVACIDLRGATPVGGDMQGLWATLFKKMPQRESETFFGFTEMVGNFRIDRAAMWFEHLADDRA